MLIEYSNETCGPKVFECRLSFNRGIILKADSITVVDDNVYVALIAIFGGVVSTIFILAHFYKFVKSDVVLSLATKSLTFYCVFLMILYTYFLVHATAVSQQHAKVFACINLYLELTKSLLLCIMGLDTCLCLRNTVLYLRRSSGSNGKFVVLCLLGAGVPLVVMLVTIWFHDAFGICLLKTVLIIDAGICLIRVVLFGFSIWYIWKASIDECKFLRRLSLHIRLVVITGIVSVMPSVTFFVYFWTCHDYMKYVRYGFELSYFYEGIVIGVFFTFKKNAFKKSITRSNSAGGVSVNLDKISVNKLTIRVNRVAEVERIRTVERISIISESSRKVKPDKL